eukprot:2863829-Amphidinium_carterae.1
MSPGSRPHHFLPQLLFTFFLCVSTQYFVSGWDSPSVVAEPRSADQAYIVDQGSLQEERLRVFLLVSTVQRCVQSSFTLVSRRPTSQIAM